MKISQLLLMGALIFTILYIIYQYQSYVRKKQKHEEILGSRTVNAKKWGARINRFLQQSYNYFLRIPILRNILITIRKRLETLAVYEEYRLRREVMKIIFTILAIFALILMVLAALRPSWLIIFWISIGFLFLSGILVDFFIYRVEEKLLKQLKEYINRIRFGYQQTKMVEEATFEAIQFAGPEMAVHAERIDKIINSLDAEQELASYEEVAPSRYLRVLAGLILLVKDRGDNITEEKSSFLDGLMAINKELNEEILYRTRLAYALRSLSVLSIIPVFIALPVKNWTLSQFPTTEAFYTSRIGFFSEVLVYVVSIVCYLIVRKMREISDTTNELTVRRNRWEEKLIQRFKVIDLLARAFSPTPYSKRHSEMKRLIQEANENMTVKGLTIQRLVGVVVISIILISSFSFSHYREKENVLNTMVNQSFFTMPFSEKERLVEVQKTEYDKEIIEEISNMKPLPSKEEVERMIRKQRNLAANDIELANAYNRIVYKWDVVSNSYLKWWEVLLSIIIAVTASYIPIFLLQFKRKARLKQMEREVYQLLVLVSILRDFEGMSVSIILTWLQRFSIAFRKSLTRAIEEFDSGPEAALDKLSESNTFEPFCQLVERLTLTLTRLSIRETFSDIGIEREYYLEQRKEDQRRSLETKQRTGNFLGLAPIVFLIFIYMIFPIMYIAVKGSSKMVEIFNIT